MFQLLQKRALPIFVLTLLWVLPLSISAQQEGKYRVFYYFRAQKISTGAICEGDNADHYYYEFRLMNNSRIVRNVKVNISCEQTFDKYY